MPSPLHAGQVDTPLDAAHRRIAEIQAALEASDARFRNIIEHNGDAIVVVGDDGTIRYANVTAGPLLATPPRA